MGNLFGRVYNYFQRFRRGGGGFSQLQSNVDNGPTIRGTTTLFFSVKLDMIPPGLLLKNHFLLIFLIGMKIVAVQVEQSSLDRFIFKIAFLEPVKVLPEIFLAAVYAKFLQLLQTAFFEVEVVY